ncbi:MAG: NAD+ synthase [Pseudomonadota bacterium]
MTSEDTALRIAVAQTAPRIGDVAFNLDTARAWRAAAAEAGADLVVFSELFISGYPPEDLVMKPSFTAECRAAIEALASDTSDGGPAVVIGAPWRTEDGVYNAAVVLGGGWILRIAQKRELPNYGVFDEPRCFTPGKTPAPALPLKGAAIGVMVCEDMWRPGVAETLAGLGADILIAPHGSPYRRTATDERQAAAVTRARSAKRPILFVNQLCGQDELVFDGGAFVVDARGEVLARGRKWAEGLEVFSFARDETGWTCIDGPQANWPSGDAADYHALVRGTRDYVRKNGFDSVLLGLSGGVDSALVAAIAVDALGPDAVRCILLPSRFTSSASNTDAEACANALGVRTDTVAIEDAVASAEAALAGVFEGAPRDVTEENIQSRMRGLLLMAISNKTGAMLLTTGNKSEVAVGYSTLYGDMNGGYNPLKDVYKTQVYRLARWRNADRPINAKGPEGAVIPDAILDKAPTAELRENQTDQDSLPDYETLDRILDGLVERDRSAADLAEEGLDAETVRTVERLLYIAEYKRRQAAPGPKITAKAFARDRRYPITNGWRSP